MRNVSRMSEEVLFAVKQHILNPDTMYFSAYFMNDLEIQSDVQLSERDRSMMSVGGSLSLAPEAYPVAMPELDTILGSDYVNGSGNTLFTHSQDSLTNNPKKVTRESIENAKMNYGMMTSADVENVLQEIKKRSLMHPGRKNLAKEENDIAVVDLIDTIFKYKQIWTDDYDGTLTFSKIFHTPDGKLDVNAYYEKGDILTLMNIDALIIKSLLGHPQHICTGKGKNFGYVREYVRERIDVIADTLHMTERMPDGALKSILDENRGVFFAISVGNGAHTEELNRRETLVHKVLPISAWEGMAQHADLLRRSSQHWRKEQIARIKDLSGSVIYNKSQDPYIPNLVVSQNEPDRSPLEDKDYLTREVSPGFTREEMNHVKLLQEAIQDHVLFEEDQNIKCNYVIDFKAIINNLDGLGDEWKSKTGITITSIDDFVEAFRILSEDWNVRMYTNEAHGTVYVDINPPDVHKGLSARWVKRAAQFYAQRDLEQCGKQKAKLPKFMTMTMADGHKINIQNDSQLLHRTHGAVSISSPERYHLPDAEGYPIYLADATGLQDALMQSYTYLTDTTLMSCPHPVGAVIENAIEELNMEHVRKMNRMQKTGAKRLTNR